MFQGILVSEDSITSDAEKLVLEMYIVLHNMGDHLTKTKHCTNKYTRGPSL